MKNALFFLLLLLTATACIKEPLVVQGDAQVKLFVCSMGCYQYVLQVENDCYFPLNLAEEFKTDGLEVTFEANLLDDKTMIKKPAPDDRPIPDFKARNIYVTSMEKK